MAARNHKKPFICSIIDGMFIRCFINVFSMFFECFVNVFHTGRKFFGLVKYFFRLNDTNAILSVPFCAVQWINFIEEKDTMSCCIGRIPMQSWHVLSPHAQLKNKQFISFDDIQPLRYALSYVPTQNIRDASVAVAFIALDSEKLGEHVYDHYHHDFGDNMFPHYLGNRKTKDIFDKADIAEDDTIARAKLSSLVQFVLKSILLFLID